MKARKIFLIFLAFCFSTSLHALTSPQRKINGDNFQKVVRPQARIILTQFYNLLDKISPEQSEMIAVKQSILDAKINWETWLKHCSELAADCPRKLEDVHRRMIHVERLVLNLQKKTFTLNSTLKSHEIDSRIDLIDTLDEMSNQSFQLINAIEMQTIRSATPEAQYTPHYLEIGQNLHFMQVDAERSFLGGLSDELQPHFDFVWNHYLKDLERYVVVEGKQMVFSQRVEDFNLSWNAFYSKMIGENFAIPEGSRPYLQIMHQTWNGILRQL